LRDIILIALEQEAPNMASWDNVFFTGVGKVNAALQAARVIERLNPRTVWNFGTAGGILLESGCHEMLNFVERDKGKCPPALEVMIPTEPNVINNGVGFTCSTGDNFVTDPDLEIPAHVVDMEAFAIAKACQTAGVHFKCFKYVSDSADESADTNWIENVSKGEEHFIRIYNDRE